MSKIDGKQLQQTKDFIYKNGRLLERKLFSYFFEDGKKRDILKALIAHQNVDGGFGNGIEPDLICPDSIAIGAETAMYVLDLLGITKHEIINDLIEWIVNTQNKEGYISHPPENLYNYPHQPWWENPDNERIFVLAGMLKKWGVLKINFFKKVREHFLSVEFPKEFNFYSYPYFVYLKYCSQTDDDKSKFSQIIKHIPSILKENQNHFPLLSRYWFYAIEYIDKEILKSEIDRFIQVFQEDGGVKIAYENLPWWRPIFTLDGLIILKKCDLLEF